MYPTSIGFPAALDRIKELQSEAFHAEALVTSVFTLEKLMRRSMRITILARGFTSKQADRLLGRGFDQLQKQWDIFDPMHEKLITILGSVDWQNIDKAVTARNRMVHGARAYDQNDCRRMTDHVVGALKKLHAEIIRRYGIDPWERIKGRSKSKLQWLS